jgi:hypothetical protein
MKDWEKRALDIWRAPYRAADKGGSAQLPEIEAMLQLGREMADEARADEANRAHAYWTKREIAARGEGRLAASVAADARAEEIARQLESRINAQMDFGRPERQAIADELRAAARVARSTITKPAQAQPLPPLSAVEDAEVLRLGSALLRWVKDNTGVECASVTVTATRKPPKTREPALP